VNFRKQHSIDPVPMQLAPLVDVLRTECYLLLKGPRMYQLQQ
jgi:hypothetical protein